MVGWALPPPSATKGVDELDAERRGKVDQLVRSGMLRSDRLRAAMLTVRREDFVPGPYRDYAYEEVPLPLPGRSATISCPHSYPLFYEALDLEEGHRFLEVGLGSGYGAALAREVVGPSAVVVSVEIDPETLGYAVANLARAGYSDVVCVLGDGALGVAEHAPYDRICVTAACPEVPAPLVEQLRAGGRLIAPIVRDSRQELTLVGKRAGGVTTTVICQVLYVRLQGPYGRPAAPVRPPPALVVTCKSLEGGRRTRAELRRVVDDGRVRGTGFRGVLAVDAPGDPIDLAERVTRSCGSAVGRVTAVLAEAPSTDDALLDAAVRVGCRHVARGERFAFRIHKRGRHGYRDATLALERRVGGAIWDAVARRDGSPPTVDLTRPDVTVNAEVFGDITLVGIVRRRWREAGGGPSDE